MGDSTILPPLSLSPDAPAGTRPDLGLAFGRGGALGAFHAGVLHALMMVEVSPGWLSGTSVGGMSAVVMALAGDRPGPEARKLVRAWIDAWLEEDIARRGWSMLSEKGGALERLGDGLLDADLTLGDVAELIRAFREGPLCFAKALGDRMGRFPPAFGRDLLPILASSARAWVRGELASPGVAVGLTQAVLDAYGLGESLSRGSLFDGRLGGVILDALKGRYGAAEDATLGGLGPDVLINVADLRQRSEDLLQPTVVTLHGRDRCVAAVRAAVALSPLCLPVTGAAVRGAGPEDDRYGDDSVLLDAAAVQPVPLSPIISRWKDRAAEGSLGVPAETLMQLVTVHTGPWDGVDDPPVHRDLIHDAHRILRLLEQANQRFDHGVVRMMTRLVDAHLREHRGLPVDPSSRTPGRRFLRVNPTAIAPREILPFMSLTLPEGTESVQRTIASGCRATLQTLYAPTLRDLASSAGQVGGEVVRVPCETLLVTLRTHGRKTGSPERFTPVATVCGGCTRVLVAPALATLDEGASVNRQSAPVAAHPPLARDAEADGSRRRLVAVVPAGGVFRGVFQFGSIAALRAYGIRADLYAGASVGTIFSLLLEAAQGSRDALVECLRAALTIDRWVDKEDTTPARGAKPVEGTVDVLIRKLLGWWRDEQRAPLRGLPLRDLRALFHEAAVDADSSDRWAAAARSVGLEGSALLTMLRRLLRGRLERAIEPLRDVLGSAGIETAEGRELLGFDPIERKLAAIMTLAGMDPAHLRLGDQRRLAAKFLFTVTDLDGAHSRVLGDRAEREASGHGTEWPLAVKGALAASSFPLAFRPRRRREVFGDAIGEPDLRYADGGIFNNFPSDTAFAWLRRLTGLPGHAWIGEVEHQVLLLSLTDPVTRPPANARLGAVTRTRWTLARAEDEKVLRTLQVQGAINHLAEQNNRTLRGEHAEQAVRASFVYVAPARALYGNPFAIKPELGFQRELQTESVAAGCRRARLALELDRETDPDARRQRRGELLETIARAGRDGSGLRLKVLGNAASEHGLCVFGRSTPEYRGEGPDGDRPREVPRCSFLRLTEGEGATLPHDALDYYRGCLRGAAADPELPDPYTPPRREGVARREP